MQKNEIISEQESWRLAKMLIEEHGENALRHARKNAEKLLFGHDIQGGAAWIRVARAVNMLLANNWTGKVH